MMEPGQLDHVYELLRAISRDRCGPSEAMARVALARASVPLASLDLLWERSQLDDSLHFDALLPSTEGTLSMSWCPDRGVPWPLRGVQRNSEADLVRVDGHTLRVGTAIALMDLVWNDDAILSRLIDAAILHKQQEVLGVDPSDVSNELLQRAMDDFRQRRNLLSVEDTERWFQDHGIDQNRLEVILADKLVRTLIRDRIIGAELPAHCTDVARFDRIALEWVGADDPEQASALFARLRDGLSTPADELRRRVTSGAVADELFVWLRRGELPADIADDAFSGGPETLLPPFKIAGRHYVARVLAVIPADPADSDVNELVREACFAEWLAERRRSANIEWFWGLDMRSA